MPKHPEYGLRLIKLNQKRPEHRPFLVLDNILLQRSLLAFLACAKESSALNESLKVAISLTGPCLERPSLTPEVIPILVLSNEAI